MHTSGRLTPEQRQELGTLATQGHSITSLTKRFTCSRHTVRRWKQEAEKRNPSWLDAPGRGRLAVLKSSERSKAKRSAKAGHTVAQVAVSLNRHRQQPVSNATVRRALVGGSHPLVWAVKRRGRVLSEKNKKARLLFCQRHLSAQTGSWAYADSKHFYCYKTGAGSLQFAWQDVGGKATLPRNSNPIHLHVYAVVAKGRKSQLIFTAPSAPRGSNDKHGAEAFSSRHFIKVAKQLQQTLRGWGMDDSRHPLILDHASQHTSHSSQAAISSMGLHLKQGFPAQCWDINIIENVWGVLDTKLKALPGRLPTTPDGWRRRLCRAWAQVDQATIDKLVGQVKGRLYSIVEKEGAWLYKYSL